MDSLITAAARALATGDPLDALNRVALREDAPALALRGIAMAQLGDFTRAKALLKRAARAFSPREAVARARCVVAEAEIALASRNARLETGCFHGLECVVEMLWPFGGVGEGGVPSGVTPPVAVPDGALCIERTDAFFSVVG